MGHTLRVSFPPLQPDELFESWLIWFCHTNHDQTAWLVNRLGIDEMVLQGFALTSEAYHALHSLSEITEDRLRASHLSSFADQLNRAYGRRYFIPGSGLNSSHVAYKVCPECLIADEQPYVRLAWALDLTCICPVHRRPLLFECPQCGKPLRLKLHEPNGPIFECRYCGADCRSIHSARAYESEAVIGFQEDLLKLSRHASYRVQGVGPVAAPAIMRMLEKLFQFVGNFPTGTILHNLWRERVSPDFGLVDDHFSFAARRLNALILCAWFVQSPTVHAGLLAEHLRSATFHDRSGLLVRIVPAVQETLRQLKMAGAH